MARSAKAQELIGELLLLRKYAVEIVKKSSDTIYEIEIMRVVTCIQDAILTIREKN
jgi:hypothetical protein